MDNKVLLEIVSAGPAMAKRMPAVGYRMALRGARL